MLTKAICLIMFAMFAASLPTAAQTSTHASPVGMRFDDPTFGVSFQYPAKWTSSAASPFMFKLTVNDPDSRQHPRAMIFKKTLAGVEGWPKTNFAGVEFGYDVHQVDSADACRTLASKATRQNTIDQVTVGGIRYWHTKTGDGGMSQALDEDIYTTLNGATRGDCFRFDTGIHSNLMAGNRPPRAPNSPEGDLIRESLWNILASVHLSTPTR